MELEFIDISRDEDVYVRPRPQSTSNRRRAARPERQSAAAAVKRRRRKRKVMIVRMTTLLFLLSLIIFLFIILVKLLVGALHKEEAETVFRASVQRQETIRANESAKPIITEDFIPVNEFSRPGDALEEVRNIFVHYTANQGTSAAQNRSYFENLGVTGETSASAHFVIGYDGEIIQCIPLDEIAYAVMKRNYDSVSIECCYLSEDGRFTDATYQSLIRLSAWLLKEYQLAPEDMKRHYDEGGKKCPLYFVEHEDAWEQFLIDLEKYIMEEHV